MDLTEGFSYTGSAQNFERDSYATLAEMKAVKAKKMPNIFIATCEETGKLYIYNKQNEDDEVLGKWREVSSGSSAGGASDGSASAVEFGVYNSYSQGYDTYTKMMADFASAGGTDFGVYSGDGGRGLDGLLPPNVAGDRAKGATVYVINASKFGKLECTLVTSAYGETYIGHFTEEATNDNFHDGDISVEWAKVASSDSIPTYDFNAGFNQQLSSNKFYQALAEEIIKHTDGVFFISATDYYSTNKYLVTYSPYYNYRQPNRWTAYYGNVVLTVSYSEQYRLSWKVHNIPSDAIVPYYIDNLPSYGNNGDTAILVKKYSYDYQQDDNGQTLYAWKAVDGDSIVYTEFQYERSEVSDLFSFDSSTGKFKKLQNEKIKSIKDNTLTAYGSFDNTLEFTRSSDDDLTASKINETVPTAELYVCKTIPESSSEWIKIGGGSENLFNNDGPSLPVYSFTQGKKTSDEMLELIGNSYYAIYDGDYGRGNEPFIPGFGGRADRATVYVENAPMFGTSKCRLFATNNKGQVFEGFFVTTRVVPTFTSDGLVWREIKTGEALTESKVKNMIEENSPVAVAYAKEIYSNVSAEELCIFLKKLYENVYQKANSVDNITIEDLSGNNNKITVENFSSVSHDELIDPTTMDRVTEYTLYLKRGDENITVKATENLSGQYTKSVPSDIDIKVSAIDPDFVESDTIDFSTWPEFSANVETSGVVLDGNGGANVDNSNVSVDPDDIEDDD